MSLPIALLSRRRTLLWAGLLAPVAALARSANANANVGASRDAAPAAMLAMPWRDGLDPADFLVSEKLDGVRALWDGQSLRFRSGRPIAAPAWWLAGLPGMALDGELWLGRHSFDVLSGIVRKDLPVDAEWRRVGYWVFDMPQAGGIFAERAVRMAALPKTVQQPWLQAVVQTRVADAAELQTRLKAVVDSGGEGLVLHRAGALWMAGRSAALRKLKPVPDEEGTVVGQIAGKGKYQGRMGALLLQTPKGQRFALGTGFSDTLRANPPPVGAVVTYRYLDRTATGLPKFASFLRVREVE